MVEWDHIYITSRYVYICSYMCVCKCVLWYRGVYMYASVHVYMHACTIFGVVKCLYAFTCEHVYGLHTNMHIH